MAGTSDQRKLSVASGSCSLPMRVPLTWLALISMLGLARGGAALAGGDADEHGCRLSAGYSWCETTSRCYRPWEESCAAALGAFGTMTGGVEHPASAAGRHPEHEASRREHGAPLEGLAKMEVPEEEQQDPLGSEGPLGTLAETPGVRRTNLAVALVLAAVAIVVLAAVHQFRRPKAWQKGALGASVAASGSPAETFWETAQAPLLEPAGGGQPIVLSIPPSEPPSDSPALVLKVRL